MGTMYMARSYMDWRSHNAFDSQFPDQQAHTHHIRHCIQGSHLMKVDLCNGSPVGLAFGLSNGCIDFQRILPHLRRQFQTAD